METIVRRSLAVTRRAAPLRAAIARNNASPIQHAIEAVRGAALARGRVQQSRNMSIFSGIRETVTNKMQERNTEKQAEAYREQVHDLAYSKKFDLDSFAAQLKKNADMAGLNGWKSYLPGMNEMTAVQQMKAFMKILEHVEPEHRQNPRLIAGKAKRVLAEKSGESAEEINNMIRSYDQLHALHLWLVKRVERGLSLPTDMKETEQLVREDPTGFPAKKFQPKRRRF